MNALSNRKTLAIALSLGAIGLCGVIAACSGGSSTNPGTGNTGDSSTPNGGDGGPGSSGGNGDSGSGAVIGTGPAAPCNNPAVDISFSPMYSAFIPGSTAQTFQIPAITDGSGTITWGASDTTTAALALDPTNPGGIVITIQGTGSVNIIATDSTGACGTSALNITQNTEDDWTTGNARYNDGVSIHRGGGGRPDGGFPEGGGGGGPNLDGGSFFEQEGGTACTNCHGPTATNGPFNDVSHTPEQTGGFSDQDLIDIVVNGIVPDGGYIDPNVIIPDASADPTGATQAKAYARWQSFHRWSDITPDEQPGIVVYLRSLTPSAQGGTSNFGGGFGGGDGGHRHHDGGKGPPPRSTAATPTPPTPPPSNPRLDALIIAGSRSEARARFSLTHPISRALPSPTSTSPPPLHLHGVNASQPSRLRAARGAHSLPKRNARSGAVSMAKTVAAAGRVRRGDVRPDVEHRERPDAATLEASETALRFEPAALPGTRDALEAVRARRRQHRQRQPPRRLPAPAAKRLARSKRAPEVREVDRLGGGLSRLGRHVERLCSHRRSYTSADQGRVPPLGPFRMIARTRGRGNRPPPCLRLLAALLGIVEGLTEYLPVSSTGHLILAGKVLGAETTGLDSFEIVIQLGAVLAVVVEYRALLGERAAGLLKGRPESKALLIALITAFLPAAVLGLLFRKAIKAHLFGLLPVAAALVVGGIVMIVVERVRAHRGIVGLRGLEHVTPKRALLIGLGQCVSMWPGSSRSMCTIVAGQLSGLSTATAAEFSFLLALPTLGAATIYEGWKARHELASGVGTTSLLIGLVVSFFVAWGVIAAFIRYLQRRGLEPFGYYRIALGAVIFWVLAR